MFYKLSIPSGTKVLSRSGLVELRAPVLVDGATRDSDGAYRYRIGGKEYICSAGCCQAEAVAHEMRHINGIVCLA